MSKGFIHITAENVPDGGLLRGPQMFDSSLVMFLEDPCAGENVN